MPQPLDVPRKKPVKLTAPILHVEVQLGSLTARGRDGHEAEGKAGETIDGEKLRVPVVLTAHEAPTRVKVFYDSEARALARRGR